MPQTLLLADDSVTIQRVIELTFADEDIDVIAVSDGDQAIARMDAEPPDILLVDIGMPGKSGYEVAAYVKQSPKLAHIPVVLLTGAFEPVDQARATAAGCDGVLAKPFEPQMVIGRVKELLGRLTRTAELPGDAFKVQETPGSVIWPVFSPAQPLDDTGGGSKKIDDYFDQLDAAFTSLSNKPASGAAPIRQAPPVPVDVDWFGLKPAPADDTYDVSMHEEAGQPFWPAPAETSDDLVVTSIDLDEIAVQGALHDVTPPTAPSIVQPPPAQPSSTQPAASYPTIQPTTLPPLADAFAALLEAEQGEPEPSARPAWPSGAGAISSSSSASAVTDDLVERVSRRVLEQLTDRALRDAVDERVSAIAERLVREEIERIKSSIM